MTDIFELQVKKGKVWQSEGFYKTYALASAVLQRKDGLRRILPRYVEGL